MAWKGIATVHSSIDLPEVYCLSWLQSICLHWMIQKVSLKSWHLRYLELRIHRYITRLVLSKIHYPRLRWYQLISLLTFCSLYALFNGSIAWILDNARTFCSLDLYSSVQRTTRWQMIYHILDHPIDKLTWYHLINCSYRRTIAFDTVYLPYQH